MRILGIDPGLRVTGFGIIECRQQQLVYVTSGVIRGFDGSLATRLGRIFSGICDIIRSYQPQCAAVELVFVNANPKSTLLLGQARGAALCALVANELVVAEYAATRIKQALVGNGRAAKQQVQHMVKHLLSLSGELKSDAADALAVAVTHAHTHIAGIDLDAVASEPAPALKLQRRGSRRWTASAAQLQSVSARGMKKGSLL